MEQLVLTSSNLSKRKEWSSGSINLTEILQQWQKDCPDNVHIDIVLPKKDLTLAWSEVSTPKQLTGFRDLVGRQLLSYPFQYLGVFNYGKKKIEGQSKDDGKVYEYVAVYMDNDRRFAHETMQAGDGSCNCTWLIDFLQNAEKISSDLSRNDTLQITTDDEKCVQFLLQKNSDRGDLIEFQSIRFSSGWKDVDYEYYTDVDLG